MKAKEKSNGGVVKQLRPNQETEEEPKAKTPMPKPGSPLRLIVDDLFRKLVAGTEKSESEIINYLVEEYKKNRVEFQKNEGAIQQLDGQLQAMRRQAVKLEGVVNKYVEDLTHILLQDLLKRDEEAKEAEKKEGAPKEEEPTKDEEKTP